MQLNITHYQIRQYNENGRTYTRQKLTKDDYWMPIACILENTVLWKHHILLDCYCQSILLRIRDTFQVYIMSDNMRMYA